MRHGAWATVAIVALATAAPAQTPAGPDFVVPAFTAYGQVLARPVYQPNGDFVVVWASREQDGDNYGIFARRFAPTGSPRGPEFQVNVQTTNIQTRPDIAVTTDGGFVVVWSSYGFGQPAEIRGRRFDRGGMPIGGEIQVNSYTTGFQSTPVVDGSPDGGFVVAWANGSDGSYWGIAARRFDAGGQPLGSDLPVNTHTPFDQLKPDLAVAADGTFLVVWEDDSPFNEGAGPGIFGQRFDAFGIRLGGEFLVNSYTTGQQRDPLISSHASGGFVVAWAGPDYDTRVSAQLFSAAAIPKGGEITVNTTGPVGTVSGLANDGAGNFAVTWVVGDGAGFLDMRGRRFDSSGAPRGGEFLISSYTTGFQEFPQVASDPAGNLIVTWSDNNRDGYWHGVFARRFGGLRPAALAVTDGGNDVLEVPDNFVLATSWQNISGASHAFQGQASEFTGPAGLVYTLGSTTASYGTVADGATAGCAPACISGALLGVRPSGHVDASVRERILPDSLGQDQRWILHVGDSFADVPRSSPFYRFVETLLHHGVTGGCSATDFCPAAATMRDQMAVFVLVAKEGAGYVPPACATPMFADVPASSPFCRWIEELARRGVVSGCGGGNYCPASPVTREQMAVFVLRTLEPTFTPPACTTPVYGDVPATSGFCPWIEELTRRGVVSGCGGGNYCPAASVTREQMGVFLGVTFGLTLYGP